MEALQHLDQQLLPNLMKMIVTWISTGILVFIFYKKFWGKMKIFMEEKRAYVTSNIEDVKAASERAKENEMQIAVELKEARMESNAIINESKEKAIKVHDEIIAKAHDEAQAKIEDARLEIEKEKQEARKDLEKEIIGVAFGAAKEVIKGNIDESKSNEIVEDFIKELNA